MNLGGIKLNLDDITVCSKRLDPFVIVTYYNGMGQDFLDILYI